MERLIGAFATMGNTKVRWDDDFVDRLNHRYTTFLLVIFAIVVSTKQYVGEPINCWCPAQFTDNHEDFTNKICWVQNTYYVPISQKKLPEPDEKHARIGYYQWVPLILLVQAILFYIPCMIWRFLNNKSGIDVNNMIDSAVSLQNGAYHDQRIKTLQFMAKHLDRYLDNTREYRKTCFKNCKHFLSRNCFLFCGKRYGNYIVFLYLACKLIYLGNVIGQLFLLNAFLGTNYHAYGYDILHKMAMNIDWTASEVFPRVTLCDFHVRTLGNIHRHTVQCVLPINLFNEKIYIFLWFWLVFVMLASLFNLLVWIIRCMLRNDHYRFVKHHLCSLLKNDLPKQDKKVCRDFAVGYLRQDGILILRLVAINADGIVVAEVIKQLWENYRAKSTAGGKRPGPTAPLMENGPGRMGREEI